MNPTFREVARRAASVIGGVRLVVCASLSVALSPAGRAFVHAQTTERVSVASDGTQANDDSWRSAISADGRYVAFDSGTSNLVPGDTNGKSDVFVHDRQTGQTTRVSVASNGAQGNNHSSGISGPWFYSVSISADGRYVAFASGASNLVPGDTNGKWDIFVHDRDADGDGFFDETGAIMTTRVSVASDGTQGNADVLSPPSISADGRYVAFASGASNLVPGDTNNSADCFVHDRQTGQTTCVSVALDGAPGNSASFNPSVSADGRYVAFQSSATNIVSGDTNGKFDIFVHDRQTGQTMRVSVGSGGTQGNDDSGGYLSVSADGRYVAFQSGASNLVSGDTNGNYDVFVHDRQTGQTTRVSVATDGTQGNTASFAGFISGDGRYVAFESSATNLVSSDTNGSRDVFVHDRQTGQTTRVSVASGDAQGNNASTDSSISADGRYVVFASDASNLVPGDTCCHDVFVRDRSATIEPIPAASTWGLVVMAISLALVGTLALRRRRAPTMPET
jgi:Tol biopolymer transport system component